VAAVGFDHQPVAGRKIAGLRFGFENQPGTSPQHHHPFVLGLVVPLARRRGVAAGVDPLQAEPWGVEQPLDPLLSRLGAGAVQQIGWARRRSGGGVSPAPADLEALAAGEIHNGLMTAAVAQRPAQGWVGFGESDEGIELPHLLQEPLQILLGHGLGGMDGCRPL
jgi:hypothetical protein